MAQPKTALDLKQFPLTVSHDGETMQICRQINKHMIIKHTIDQQVDSLNCSALSWSFLLMYIWVTAEFPAPICSHKQTHRLRHTTGWHKVTSFLISQESIESIFKKIYKKKQLGLWNLRHLSKAITNFSVKNSGDGGSHP